MDAALNIYSRFDGKGPHCCGAGGEQAAREAHVRHGSSAQPTSLLCRHSPERVLNFVTRARHARALDRHRCESARERSLQSLLTQEYSPGVPADGGLATKVTSVRFCSTCFSATRRPSQHLRCLPKLRSHRETARLTLSSRGALPLRSQPPVVKDAGEAPQQRRILGILRRCTAPPLSSAPLPRLHNTSDEPPTRPAWAP